VNPPPSPAPEDRGALREALDRFPRLRDRLPGLFRAMLLVVLAVNVAIVTWYICSGYRYWLHSDAAFENLLAGEIFDTGRYFPPGFNYANFDLWVWYGQTYIVPLLPFFPNTFALHAASGMVSFGLILLGTWLLSGLVLEGRWPRLAALAVVTAAWSDVMADNVFGQVSYGTTFYQLCFAIYFAVRGLSHESPRRLAWRAAFGLVIAILFWANPLRATILFGAPLAVALSLHGFVGWWREGQSAAEVPPALATFATLALASIFGVGLHVATLKGAGIHIAGGAGTALWLQFEQMLRNVTLTVMGLVALLGGLPTPSGFVARPAGLYQALRLVAALAIVGLAPWAMGRALLQPRAATRFVGAITITVTAAVLFIQMTTTVPDMSDPVQSARYMIPPLLLCVILLLAAIGGERQRWIRTLVGGAAITLLATSAYTAMVLPTPAVSWTLRLGEFLERNGLHYGYATYWNAGAVTVHTGGEVKVRQVLFTDGLPVPYRHLSSDRWYLPEAWKGETFLAVHPTEASQVDLAKLTRLMGPPRRTLESDGVKIYVFDHNLAGSLPGWSR
jgi:hypothetical protein